MVTPGHPGSTPGHPGSTPGYPGSTPGYPGSGVSSSGGSGDSGGGGGGGGGGDGWEGVPLMDGQDGFCADINVSTESQLAALLAALPDGTRVLYDGTPPDEV